LCLAFFIFLYLFWVLEWRYRGEVVLPGKAVAALGAAAGVMSVIPEITGAQRFMWILILVAFFRLELIVLREDHASHQRDDAGNSTTAAREL